MKKTRRLLILLLAIWTSITSCDKNDPTEQRVKIKFINLTLKKTEETSAIVEAIVKNSKKYEFGFVLSSSDLNNIVNTDSCSYFKVENNSSDTITLEIKDLNPSTLYYCAMYYFDEGDYKYDESIITFHTKEIVEILYDTIYDIEKNLYKTITIGQQTWMAENLRTTTYNDSTPIENLITNGQWYNDSIGGYCWYDNNIDYKNTKGALYNGYTIGSNKLCPVGWHIPSNDEWRQLIGYLNNHGFLNYQAEALKSEFGWSENSNGENRYGFTALPSGYRNEVGKTYDIEKFAGYWSSNKNNLNQYYLWKLNTSNNIQQWIANRNVGFSVRCVMD